MIECNWRVRLFLCALCAASASAASSAEVAKRGVSEAFMEFMDIDMPAPWHVLAKGRHDEEGGIRTQLEVFSRPRIGGHGHCSLTSDRYSFPAAKCIEDGCASQFHHQKFNFVMIDSLPAGHSCDGAPLNMYARMVHDLPDADVRTLLESFRSTVLDRPLLFRHFLKDGRVLAESVRLGPPRSSSKSYMVTSRRTDDERAVVEVHYELVDGVVRYELFELLPD